MFSTGQFYVVITVLFLPEFKFLTLEKQLLRGWNEYIN